MTPPPRTLDAVLRSLGLRMHEVRRRRGLTQEQAAARLRMDPTNYARIERGRVNVTMGTLVRIAAALGVTPRELLMAPRIRRVRPGRPRKRS